MKRYHNLFKRMDTSNLPSDHSCFSTIRMKVPGTFTDEAKGRPIREFIALRSKSYAYDLAGEEKIKAKGIQGHVVKNHMTIDDHKKCLFWSGKIQAARESRDLAVHQSKQFKLTGFTSENNEYTPFRVNKSLRSFKHKIKTISTVKLSFNRYDDKRYVLPDQIYTLAHGHYHIKYEQLNLYYLLLRLIFILFL